MSKYHIVGIHMSQLKCTMNSGKDNLWCLQIHAYMINCPNFIVTNRMQYSVNLERAERE